MRHAVERPPPNPAPTGDLPSMCLLREADRDVLRDEHFRTIASLSSPMVPGNAATMLELLGARQLAVARGVRKIEAGNGGFRVRTDMGVRGVDVVINAVNPSPHSIPESASALTTSMLARPGRPSSTRTAG